MNKRILAATLGFCLLAGGIAAVPRLVDERAARDTLTNQVEAVTGARLALAGPGQFTFSPWPTFLYDKASLAAPDGSLSAELTGVRITVMPLASWFGGAGLSVDVEGFSARIAAIGSWYPARFDRAWLGRLKPFTLTLNKGTVAIESPADTLFGAADRRRLDVELAQFDWPRENATASAALSAVWNGRMVRIEAEAPSLARLAAGETGAFSLDASAQGEDEVSFDGSVAVADMPSLDGAFELVLVNPLSTLRWLGETRRWPQVSELAVSGQLSTTARGWSLSRLKGSLGDATADGGLSIAMSQGRPLIQGTLAFDQIDLRLDQRDTVTLASLQPLLNEPVSPDILSAADVDVLVSTNRLRLPGVALRTVSGALILREGRLRVEVSDGELGGGRADGHVEVRAADEGFAARGRLALKDVRVGELISALPPLGIDDAVMSFTAEASARGASAGAVLGALSGRCESDVAKLDHGAVAGLPTLGTSEPFIGPLDHPRTRAIRFDRVRLVCEIRDGGVAVSRLEAKVGETSAALAGRFAGPEAVFDMTGTLTANKTTGPVPISLTGPWSAPLVSPLSPPSVN